MRASDAERDRAVGQLRDRFAEGWISQDTFLYRMDAALRAKDRSELSDLFRDLPGTWHERPAPQQPVRAALTRFRQPPHADGRFTIGRALACDFTLADLSVSRWHAKLHREDEHWMLSDLGSTN